MNNEQAYNDYLTAWLNGIEYEINFWDNFIQTKGKDFNTTEEQWKNYIAYERPFTLNDDLFLEETNFLDVGSGPFSSCGTKKEKTKSQVILLHMVQRMSMVQQKEIYHQDRIYALLL